MLEFPAVIVRISNTTDVQPNNSAVSKTAQFCVKKLAADYRPTHYIIILKLVERHDH